MAKKGIKVQDLAKELGVTSRRLIDRCREEGLAVQNSITKIELHQAEVVRKWFSTVESSDSERESGDVSDEVHG
ncbi:MAG: translation initiation factor IF-2 N-terminal domain-containing protein [Planctomycetota bacterium]